MVIASSSESGLAAWIEAARAAEKPLETKGSGTFDEVLQSAGESAESPRPASGSIPEVDREPHPSVQEEYTRAVAGISKSLQAFGVDPSTLTFNREALLCWNPNGFVLENTIWATAANGERIGFREDWAARTPEVSAAEICSQLLGVSTAPGAYQPLLESTA
jgi:hypothetical protein